MRLLALTVRFPDHINPRRARDIDALHAHPLNVVQPGHETFQIAASAELGFPPVPLVRGAKVVVVGRIAICQLVQENGVEGDGTPVVRRGRVRRAGVGRILGGRLGVLVGVEVVVNEVCPVWRGCGEVGERQQRQECCLHPHDGEETDRRAR